MEMSNDIGALAKALAAAQAELDGSFVATHTAKIAGREGKQGYEYKYGDLADALRATRCLNRHGIAVVQPTSTTERGVKVVTQLSHESGQWMRSEPLIMPVGVNNAQAVGSAITYARRYQLLGMVGLAPEDDDGKEADDHPPPQERAARRSRSEQAGAETDLGPRCRGKRAGGIAKAIHERCATIGSRLGKSATVVYKSVLKKIDAAKYGAEPMPEDLTVVDGTTVSQALQAKLAELDAADKGVSPSDTNSLRAECVRLYGLLAARAPDDFTEVEWQPEWAKLAGLEKWPTRPSVENFEAAADGMRLALERIDAP